MGLRVNVIALLFSLFLTIDFLYANNFEISSISIKAPNNGIFRFNPKGSNSFLNYVTLFKDQQAIEIELIIILEKKHGVEFPETIELVDNVDRFSIEYSEIVEGIRTHSGNRETLRRHVKNYRRLAQFTSLDPASNSSELPADLFPTRKMKRMGRKLVDGKAVYHVRIPIKTSQPLANLMFRVGEVFLPVNSVNNKSFNVKISPNKTRDLRIQIIHPPAFASKVNKEKATPIRRINREVLLSAVRAGKDSITEGELYVNDHFEPAHHEDTKTSLQLRPPQDLLPVVLDLKNKGMNTVWLTPVHTEAGLRLMMKPQRFINVVSTDGSKKRLAVGDIYGNDELHSWEKPFLPNQHLPYEQASSQIADTLLADGRVVPGEESYTRFVAEARDNGVNVFADTTFFNHTSVLGFQAYMRPEYQAAADLLLEEFGYRNPNPGTSLNIMTDEVIEISTNNRVPLYQLFYAPKFTGNDNINRIPNRLSDIGFYQYGNCPDGDTRLTEFRTLAAVASYKALPSTYLALVMADFAERTGVGGIRIDGAHAAPSRYDFYRGLDVFHGLYRAINPNAIVYGEMTSVSANYFAYVGSHFDVLQGSSVRDFGADATQQGDLNILKFMLPIDSTRTPVISGLNNHDTPPPMENLRDVTDRDGVFRKGIGVSEEHAPRMVLMRNIAAAFTPNGITSQAWSDYFKESADFTQHNGKLVLYSDYPVPNEHLDMYKLFNYISGIMKGNKYIGSKPIDFNANPKGHLGVKSFYSNRGVVLILTNLSEDPFELNWESLPSEFTRQVKRFSRLNQKTLEIANNYDGTVLDPTAIVDRGTRMDIKRRMMRPFEFIVIASLRPDEIRSISDFSIGNRVPASCEKLSDRVHSMFASINPPSN